MKSLLFAFLLLAVMRLLPEARYGQFCSAATMVRSILFAIAGPVCGKFLDWTARFGVKPDDCYRFVPVWNVVFMSLNVLFLWLLYREWKKLGGSQAFRPPDGTAVTQLTP